MDEECYDEMKTLSKFQTFREKNLLSHPLVETYLHLKWITVKKFLHLNILLYVLYLLSLTILAILTARGKYEQKVHNTRGPNMSSVIHENQIRDKKQRTFYGLEGIHGTSLFAPWIIFYVISLITTSFILVREIIQLVNEKWAYVRSIENLIEMTALLSTYTYLILTPFENEYEALFGAIAMFGAWWEMTLMLGRIPSIGKYTYMSTKVVRQLLQFLMVYSTTLFAFAMAFHLLLVRDYGQGEKNGVFENIWTSFLKVQQ